MFKVNNKDTRPMPSSVSVVNCEHVNAGWVGPSVSLVLPELSHSIYQISEMYWK